MLLGPIRRELLRDVNMLLEPAYLVLFDKAECTTARRSRGWIPRQGAQASRLPSGEVR